MKWTYGIRQKTKVAGLLAAVCVIVLLKNVYDKHNVDELGTTFSSVYEDRLLVESYIYELSDHLYQKKIMVDNIGEYDRAGISDRLRSHHEAISTIIADYEKTKFTDAETTFFRDFKTNVATLRLLESQYLQLPPNVSERTAAKDHMNRVFDNVSRDLHLLSDIQVSEGKLLNDHSKKIVAGSSMLTQLELAILITIAILIQVLVIASKPVLPVSHQRASLN